MLDCCDNFATRHAVNAACVRAGKPLVSGAALRFDGQVAVFDPRDADAPCYHCLFGEGEELEETRCATMGVFAPLVGIVGATQAAEALKLIAGVGTIARRPPAAASTRLTMQWRELARAARSRVPGVRGDRADDEAAHASPRCASLLRLRCRDAGVRRAAGRRADAAGRRNGPRSAR